MGGSGGFFFGDDEPKTLSQRIRKAEERAETQEFDAAVAGELDSRLREYNDRDVSEISHALDDVKACLEGDIEGTVDLIFGGSVHKHTYVDGVSDVDALVILRDERLATLRPGKVLDYFEDQLRKRLKGWHVRPHGNLAVTVEKKDLVLQLVPAVPHGVGVRIPLDTADQWSRIRPRVFSRTLSRLNEKMGRRLIPVIKLAKAANATYPERSRLSGYHIEALAVEAFRAYKGPKHPKAMLEHFFDRANQAVLSPVRDTTGQSTHVDEYLGPQNSEARRLCAANLERTLRRMKNANAARSVEQWLRALGED